MGFIDLVLKRKSIRSFLSTPVDRTILDKCLEAARLAPSACNAQPWQFFICDKEPLRSELSERAFSGIYSMNSFAKEAPVLVVVAKRTTKVAPKVGGLFQGVDFGLIDIGIACDHFQLAAAEEDLGTCLLGWFNSKAVVKILNLPKNLKPTLMIAVGYPKGPMGGRKDRLPLEEVRSYIESPSK
ncbi:nitroreductase [Thermovirga lienii DSM 17291]|jgi:nitroreductase|uniref:Nitroreductase n=1 Tax=Thermovirga lienii (strain ATCC BAA-1197 / DSM 17291 / Cas60314) TaxID=580340 RepID=G7V802_THELD|nr:nitroreductase family protein [Thermovirga lienii]AER66238.1 nitroreductase [Thermovirga lienii DSM 17291]KUK42692.1 MAG: Nitroreductase [Thermovirga lienii]MDN5319571.1 hypothetical protein [Thermovirga sp.]HCD71340.1 nitroreductase [Thermovirga lienii]